MPFHQHNYPNAKVELRMTKSASSHKFLQSIDDDYFYLLGKAARTRGVTVQELIRAVIIPDWISNARRKTDLGTIGAPSAGSRAEFFVPRGSDTRS